MGRKKKYKDEELYKICRKCHVKPIPQEVYTLGRTLTLEEIGIIIGILIYDLKHSKDAKESQMIRTRLKRFIEVKRLMLHRRLDQTVNDEDVYEEMKYFNEEDEEE